MVLVLLLLAVVLPSLAPAQDFAEEAGQNVGPRTPAEETDQTIFADGRSPDSFLDDLVAPIRAMSIDAFQRHVSRAYGRTLSKLEEEAKDEESSIAPTVLRPTDLELFWEYVFNPSALATAEEERVFLQERFDHLVAYEGLEDPTLDLPPGFLTRGNCLHQMFKTKEALVRLHDRLEREREEREL